MIDKINENLKLVNGFEAQSKDEVEAFRIKYLGKKGILNNLPGDLLSIDLKEAIEHVGTITGKIDADNDILDAIFSKFCIGK